MTDVLSQPLPPTPPRRAWRYVAGGFAIVLIAGFAWLSRREPPAVARPIVRFSAAATREHYRRNPVHDLVTFLAKYDRDQNGTISQAELAAAEPIARHEGLRRDLGAILSPAQALDALGRLERDLAEAHVRARHAVELELLRRDREVREAYWRMDMQSQALVRGHALVAASTLATIDGGGRRRVHGAEDLPPVMPFDAEHVRAYPVPWPSGNVAVARVNGRVRVFLTPFPDGNFGDTQVHELDLERGGLAPYPPRHPALQRALRASLGLEAHDGLLYVVDHGGYGLRDARLVAIDLLTDEPVLDYPFSIRLGQMPNDIAFVDDAEGTHLFISDTAPGRTPSGSFNARSGIFEIVVRRAHGHLQVVRRARHLDGDPLVEDGGWSMYPGRDRPARTWLGKLAWGGVDGIAAHDGQIYFRRMQAPEIRVAPAGALDAGHTRIVDLFPFIDGFRIDDAGVLWYGDVETSSLFAYDLRSRVTVKVAQDARLHWLDEVNVLDDKAYVTTSHLHEYMWAVFPWQRRRAVEAAAPFHFYVVDLAPARATITALREELSHDPE
jgi:hypothetical protein